MTKIEYYWWMYFLLSGCISGLYYMLVISPDKEWEDKVRDIVWNTGLSDQVIRSMGFSMCILLGFWFVPKKLIKFLISPFKKEK